MKKTFFVLFLFQLLLCSCQTDFVSSEWIKHNSMEDINNPRSGMTDDLFKNHLKKGMTKAEVVKLLGEPLSDIDNAAYLPKHKTLPDTLKINYDIKQTDKEKDILIEKANKWYKENYISIKMISYPIGWSLIDSISLEIWLTENDVVEDFWIKQH